jgi:hypothetical protein
MVALTPGGMVWSGDVDFFSIITVMWTVKFSTWLRSDEGISTERTGIGGEKENEAATSPFNLLYWLTCVSAH